MDKYGEIREDLTPREHPDTKARRRMLAAELDKHADANGLEDHVTTRAAQKAAEAMENKAGD